MIKLFLSAAVIFLIACSGKNKTPDSILPPPKMEAVLWDILRADELATVYKVNDTLKSPLQWHTGMYDTIFKLHEVTKEEFHKSFLYYQGRPDLLKPVFEKLSKQSDESLNKDLP